MLCLETLALNILKDSSPEKIVNDIDIPELNHACYTIKNFFHSICPRPDCKKEVEEAQPRDYVSSTVDSMPGSQNISDLMDISPLLFADIQLYSSSSKKRVSEIVSTEKSSSKKLIGDPSESLEISGITKFTPASQLDMTKLETFIPLYQNINTKSNNDKASHTVLRSYLTFGLWISNRYGFHRKSNSDHTAQVRVNDHINYLLIIIKLN
ncbi:hypothetical protein Glove_13g257 [Diversispora epigaea]|uniref:Uncharacterized protein n=1 Tax=Diversispora epigaea TaxID=1348612 RepID=A0A397JMG1_9GLOM|nr:hypothetical protein Glove_13g257 [Diversispora epigaea]